ncbi:MAG: ABC transporter permease [Dehalococcoidales bacterium]|jgi:peptide/nickel transport system permease protein
MITYATRRLLLAVITILLVTLIVFFMVRILPGDPLLMMMSRDQYTSVSPEQLQILRHQYGLDKPVIVQYIRWLPGLFHGDFGKSTSHLEPVSTLLARRVPVSLYLGLVSFVIANILGILAGTISALRRGTKIDMVVTILANIGVTIPIFWMGIMLIYVFGFRLGWLPTNGYISPFENFWLSIKLMIMPVACESVFTIGAISRQTRSSMLEVIRQDYIRTARAKGLRERTLVMRHVLKNGLITITTLSGMQLSSIIGGTVLIETVFNIPGMGRLAVDAVRSLDYTVIQAVVLLIAIMVTSINFLVDISYGWLDPRIRYN